MKTASERFAALPTAAKLLLILSAALLPIGAALVWLARLVRPIERHSSIAIHSALGTQILIGIATVTSGVALPVATLHQAVGALLVAATAWGLHILGRRTA